MTFSSLRIPWNSIRFKLNIGVLIFIVPLIILMIYNNFYAIKVVHNQVAESYKNMMTLYMGQIDSSLEDMDKYLVGLMASEVNTQIVEYANNGDDSVLASISLNTKLSEDIVKLKSVNSIFIYSNQTQNLLEVYTEGAGFTERESVRAYIRNLADKNTSLSDFNTKGWYIQKINQEYYLFRVCETDNIFIGAWVNVKKLMIPLALINFGENGTSLLATDDGQPISNQTLVKDNSIDLKRDLESYYLSGNRKQYLVVGEKSGKGDFSLIAIIPDDKILEKLPYLQRVVTSISVGLSVLVPVCLLLLWKILLSPLKRMLSTMKQIHDGDLEVRIENYPTSDEFQTVNETFNKMVDRIHELKINVYEEQLNKQKAELQHLQLQINPHFFMNSYNMIYSLAQTKDYVLIQELTLLLVQYFRYIFKSNLTFVPLRDELQHVNNYFHIQKVRFAENLNCRIDVPDALLDIPVPPLVIHTFVENTVKYAVTMDDPVYLTIQAVPDISKPVPCIIIRICDTGKGFPDEVLHELCAGHRIIDAQGEHIGIWNVMQRLKLLYSMNAGITFANGHDPIGAVVEITLPVQPENGGDVSVPADYSR